MQLLATAAAGSATASITIVYPAPAISSVSPNPLTAGAFTLTLNGTGFRSGAVVKLNNSTLSTTYVSMTRLTASGTTSTADTAIPLTVTNPDAQVSAAFHIAVTGASPISVSITPTSATVRVRRTVRFTATVSNTSDTRVTWRATAGTISSSGLYTAPATVPANPVTVTARSVADATKFATAAVQIRRR